MRERRYDVGVFQYSDPVIRVDDRTDTTFKLPPELGAVVHDTERIRCFRSVASFINITEGGTGIHSSGYGGNNERYWSDGRLFSTLTASGVFANTNDSEHGTFQQTRTPEFDAEGRFIGTNLSGDNIILRSNNRIEESLTSFRVEFDDIEFTQSSDESGMITFSWSGEVNRVYPISDFSINDSTTLSGSTVVVPDGELTGHNITRMQEGTLVITELMYIRVVDSMVYESGDEEGERIEMNIESPELESVIVEKRVDNIAQLRAGSGGRGSSSMSSVSYSDPIEFSYHGVRGEYSSVGLLRLNSPWLRVGIDRVNTRARRDVLTELVRELFDEGLAELRCRSLVKDRIRIVFTELSVFDRVSSLFAQSRNVDTEQLILEPFSESEVALSGDTLSISIAVVFEEGVVIPRVEREVINANGDNEWVSMTFEEVECSL